MNTQHAIRLTSLPAPVQHQLVSARFPVNYEAARVAIIHCDRIDEVKKIDDQSVAMAAYAKQANDNVLRECAERIQVRARSRLGDLLREYSAVRPRSGANTAGVLSPRAAAAKSVGMKPATAREAVRLSQVPAITKEKMIERSPPAKAAEIVHAHFPPKAREGSAAADPVVILGADLGQWGDDLLSYAKLLDKVPAASLKSALAARDRRDNATLVLQLTGTIHALRRVLEMAQS